MKVGGYTLRYLLQEIPNILSAGGSDCYVGVALPLKQSATHHEHITGGAPVPVQKLDKTLDNSSSVCARSAVGLAELPFSIPVEVEAEVECNPI